LAEAYLRYLLRKQAELHALSLRQYLHLSPAQQTKTIFIVDECGLEAPLHECVRKLRMRCSKSKLLLLGLEKSTDEVVRAIIMGFDGYLTHSDVHRKLVRARFSVAADNLWVPPAAFHEFLCEAASALRKNTQVRQTTTPREQEILDLVQRRLSNREIAESLRIKVSTVKFHLSNILSKMQAQSRRELVRPPSAQLLRSLSA
jgi:DNA-binding NarL/FixJ family response regulator